MEKIYANVLNEIEKIFLKKRNILFLLVTAFCTLMVSLGVSFLQGKYGITVATGSSFPIFILGFFAKIFLPLFIFMVGADMFAGEASERTLKLAMTKPISRLEIFVSKNTALAVYAAINLLTVLLITSIAGLFFSAKGNIFSGLLTSFGVYFADMAPVVVLVLLISCVSQLFKSSSSALTACILIYIGFYVLSVIFPIVDSISLTNMLDWHYLWIGGNAAAGRIINTLVQMLAYAIMFFSLGSYMFDKKEI